MILYIVSRKELKNLACEDMAIPQKCEPFGFGFFLTLIFEATSQITPCSKGPVSSKRQLDGNDMSPVPTVLDRIERIGLVSCKFPEIKTLPAWLLLFTPFLFFASIAYASNTEISVVDRRPNIIWIVVEDISPDLGAYGNAIVHTPNIDRLAVGGIRYTRAFSTSSVCSPSRSAFFTGMYQTSIGAHHHRSHIDDGYRLPAGVKLVTQYLRDAGYFTLLMGPKQKTDFNFTPHVEPFDADDGKQVISGGAYTHDPADKAILEGAAWQQYPGDRPFFAVVNYSEAHRDFTHDPVNPIDPNDVALPSYYPDHDIARRDWALYLETIQLLDRKIGNLMQELESHGALDNTIIMLFGDHGRAMLRDKQWLYDGGIHVPLVIWGNGIETGVVRDDLVSLIDLAPTTMDIAGLEVPGHMEGNIFLGENRRMREFIFAQRDRCDETDDRIRAVRDKRFKYIVNHIPGQPYLAFNAYKNLRYDEYLDWWDKELKRMGK